jgi:hypothetical protein
VNIFASSPCPEASAATLADRHVVKMILETAQILSTAIERHVDPADFANFDGYKPTHRNHPCTLWAGDTRANFDWTVRHGLALGAEYTRRFSKVHKSQAVIERAWLWRDRIPVGALTDFAQAMPDVHRGPDPHSAYQRYLRAKYNDWRAAGRPPRWRAGIAR